MSVQAVLDRLAAIEAEALAVYAAHGLPIRSGHYRRGPRAGSWAYLAATLSPEERWAQVLARPPEKGWRHAALADLGQMDGRPGPRLASQTLKTAARLRARLSSGDTLTPEDLFDALTISVPAPKAGVRARSRSRS